MEAEVLSRLSSRQKEAWLSLLAQTGLTPESEPDSTVLIRDGDLLIATGSREKNILKYLAVSPARQGEDLTATVLTSLRQDAFQAGYRHLFLYTKPKNKVLFSSLFFYPIAQTEDVLLMEDRRNGIRDFLASLPEDPGGGTVGALVMNCNPFTKGHRYLAEYAAENCDRVYLFVLSEESPPFPSQDRLELVRQGTADLPNITVLPTGPYLISAATFPTYFLKDRDSALSVQCGLDLEIFARYYAPRFHITRRFVGAEPLSAMTRQYNDCLHRLLPEKGISVCQIPRLESEGTPISASAVRALLGTGQEEAIRRLVPDTTFTYLRDNHYI